MTSQKVSRVEAKLLELLEGVVSGQFGEVVTLRWWSCSSRARTAGGRSGVEVEERVSGSPVGYHPQLESSALRIC